MKKLQFSLVLSLVVLAVAACNKEEQAPPVETAPAETMAPPSIEETTESDLDAPVDAPVDAPADGATH